MNLFRDFGAAGDVLMNALMRVIPILICITFHELAHGYTAFRLGDRTAKDMGRLTLNPIKHIDIFGLIMMMLFRFGWAKPVPVNMHNFQRPKLYMAITAIAGPVSNIILASVVLFLYGLFYEALGGDFSVGAGAIARELIENTAIISVFLAVFNLMPIPPLDGSKVLFSLLPEDIYYKLMRYERFGIIILILAINTSIFQNTIGKLAEAIFSSLVFFWETAYRFVN